jgi:predicted enzyme related to lactoylglutathione lyase
VAEEKAMPSKPAVATRLRGVWFGVRDIERSRAFYERLGAYFEDQPGPEGVVYATLGDMRLNFELVTYDPGQSTGYVLLFDVTDADALHDELRTAGCAIAQAPHDTPWGRHFMVTDPDGHSIAFVGPIR